MVVVGTMEAFVESFDTLFARNNDESVDRPIKLCCSVWRAVTLMANRWAFAPSASMGSKELLASGHELIDSGRAVKLPRVARGIWLATIAGVRLSNSD